MEHVQPDITAHMRAVLVDWLVEVQQEFRLVSETLFLAVNYIDRFLTLEAVPRSRLQLVGVACTLLACKTEELSPPGVDKFVYVCDGTYSREDVVKMERHVLSRLRFEVTAATPYAFLMRYAKCAQANTTIIMLAKVCAARDYV